MCNEKILICKHLTEKNVDVDFEKFELRTLF